MRASRLPRDIFPHPLQLPGISRERRKAQKHRGLPRRQVSIAQRAPQALLNTLFSALPPEAARRRALAAAAKRLAREMTHVGTAVSTENQTTRQRNLFNAFLADMAESADPASAELSSLWGTSFDNVPESEAATTRIYGYFATWLIETYIIPKGEINAGKPLSQGTAHGYWSGLLNQMRVKYGKSPVQGDDAADSGGDDAESEEGRSSRLSSAARQDGRQCLGGGHEGV